MYDNDRPITIKAVFVNSIFLGGVCSIDNTNLNTTLRLVNNDNIKINKNIVFKLFTIAFVSFVQNFLS